MTARITVRFENCQRCGKRLAVASRSIYGADRLKAQFGILCDGCATDQEKQGLNLAIGEHIATPGDGTMDAQQPDDLTQHDCTCRVCHVVYIGHGALCETHARELAEQQSQERARANAVLEKREAAQRATRRARGRSEWAEGV